MRKKKNSYSSRNKRYIETFPPPLNTYIINSVFPIKQKLRRQEEERAERHRKRVQEISEQKAREEQEKEYLFQKEQEVYLYPPPSLYPLVHVQPWCLHGPIFLQRLRQLDEEKAERNRRRLQEIAEQKARDEEEKERQFLQEQEVTAMNNSLFLYSHTYIWQFIET